MLLCYTSYESTCGSMAQDVTYKRKSHVEMHIHTNKNDITYNPL